MGNSGQCETGFVLDETSTNNKNKNHKEYYFVAAKT